MHRLILFSALFGFAACGGDKAKPAAVADDKKEVVLTAEQKIQAEVAAIIDKSLKNPGTANPRLVSGFEFGMSRELVEEHTQKMMKKGALKKVKKSSNTYQYVYQLPTSSKQKTDTYMEADYKDGGLFKLICTVHGITGLGTADALLEAKTFLESLYGKPVMSLPSYNSCDHYLWINGRMHIDLKCELDGAQFVFTDLQEEKPSPQFDPAPTGNQVDISDTKHE